MKAKNRDIMIVFILALALRSILFVAVWSWNGETADERVLAGDGGMYRNIALNLLEHNGFSNSISPPYVQNTFRTPVYPLFLASLYGLFGYKVYIPIICQIFVSSFTCVAAFKIGEMLFNEKTALFAGLLAAIEYSSVIFANILVTDTLFSFLFVGHVYYLIRSLKSESDKTLAYSALLLGIATLCRPVSVYFFLFLIGVFTINYKNKPSSVILKYSMFAAVFILSVMPWVIHNYTVSGKFLVSSIQESVLRWNLPQVTQSLQNLSGLRSVNDSVPPIESQKTEQKYSRLTHVVSSARKDARQYMSGAVKFFASIGSSAYPRLLGISSNTVGSTDNKGLMSLVKTAFQVKNPLELSIIFAAAAFLLLLYIFMSLGVYLAVKQKKTTEILLLLTIVAYFVLASAPLPPNPRYRMPIMPFIIILSCYGLSNLRKSTSKRDAAVP